MNKESLIKLAIIVAVVVAIAAMFKLLPFWVSVGCIVSYFVGVCTPWVWNSFKNNK